MTHYSESKFRVCGYCGKVEPRPYHKKPIFYCSKQCFLKRRREVEWRNGHPLLPHKCKLCNKKFVPSRNGTKYCSAECAKKGYYQNGIAFYRRHPQAKANSNRRWRMRTKWNGNWYKALVRDNFTCTMCEFVADRPNSLKDRKILVHHIDGRGEGRGDNHELLNLTTLCYPCHRKVHQE